jgi:hypothetical protein
MVNQRAEKAEGKRAERLRGRACGHLLKIGVQGY